MTKLFIGLDPGTVNTGIAYLIKGEKEIKTFFIQKPKIRAKPNFCLEKIKVLVDKIYNDNSFCRDEIRVYCEDCITGRINAKTQHENLDRMVKQLCIHFGNLLRLVSPIDWRYDILGAKVKKGVNDKFELAIKARHLVCDLINLKDHERDAIGILFYGIDQDKHERIL